MTFMFTTAAESTELSIVETRVDEWAARLDPNDPPDEAVYDDLVRRTERMVAEHGTVVFISADGYPGRKRWAWAWDGVILADLLTLTEAAAGVVDHAFELVLVGVR